MNKKQKRGIAYSLMANKQTTLLTEKTYLDEIETLTSRSIRSFFAELFKLSKFDAVSSFLESLFLFNRLRQKKKISVLNFEKCEEIVIPSSIKYLFDLDTIQFDHVKEIKLPFEISLLNLISLKFFDCKHIYCEKGVFFHQLKFLYFEDYESPSFPSFITKDNIPNLEILSYERGRLTNIPRFIFELPIKEIILNTNLINIDYRTSINNQITMIDLSSNNLQFFPFDLDCYNSLNKLNLKLDNNRLLELPFSIFRKIDPNQFSSNWLEGTIGFDYRDNALINSMRELIIRYISFKEKKQFEGILSNNEISLLVWIHRLDPDVWIKKALFLIEGYLSNPHLERIYEIKHHIAVLPLSAKYLNFLKEKYKNNKLLTLFEEYSQIELSNERILLL